MLQADHFELERLAPDHYRLHWPATAESQVQSVGIALGAEQPALPCAITLAAGSAELSGLPPAPRHFFHVALSDGRTLLLAERRLALRGTPNFRDFGGYTNSEGQRVRWGQLFRSGQLDLVDGDDQAAIAALNIGLVCDFRHDVERERAPNRFADSHRPRIENLSIMPGSAVNVFAQIGSSGGTSAEQMAQLMVEINRDLASQQRATYQRLFELVADHDGPVLIHCAAGKDRTGFGAALILAALGVPEAVLLHDYLLTDRYLPIETDLLRIREKYQLDIPDEVIRPMLEVRREYLHGALETAKNEFGSLDNYLRSGLQLSAPMLAGLRERLLEN